MKKPKRGLNGSFHDEDKIIHPTIKDPDTGNKCCWVISEGGTWLPGCYEDSEAAWAAFELKVETMQHLQDETNEKGTGIITLAMIEKLL